MLQGLLEEGEGATMVLSIIGLGVQAGVLDPSNPITVGELIRKTDNELSINSEA